MQLEYLGVIEVRGEPDPKPIPYQSSDEKTDPDEVSPSPSPSPLPQPGGGDRSPSGPNKIRSDGPSSERYCVIHRQSYSVLGSALGCAVTGIFYGGWCWTYFARPFSGEEWSFYQDTRRKILQEHDGRVTLLDYEIHVNSWSYLPPLYSTQALEGSRCQRFSETLPPPEGTISMTGGQYVAGGIVSVLVPFGLGHAIQGRWSTDGWKFTVFPLASLGLAGAACMNGHNCWDAFTLGMFAIGVGRIWEMVDAWATPTGYGDRYYAGRPPRISPVFALNSARGPAPALGVQLTLGPAKR